MTATVEQLWPLSDDELFARLGRSLMQDGHDMSPNDDDGHRRFGVGWFRRHYADLRRHICGDERLDVVTRHSAADRTVDAITVQQILSNFAEYSTNAALIAVLVVRLGLSSLCAGYPDPDVGEGGE
jgi:hypothetical protein